MSVIEIFRAGRHTAQNGAEVEISGGDLAEAAKAYDPASSEAPVVVGHPAADAPAYGWVKSLRATAGALLAELTQVDPEFADLVRKGRYKKISASFYAPDSPANPKKGAWYLRHVGFLGAQPPAVKGLRAVSFSGALDGVMEFTPMDSAWSRVAGLMKGLRALLADKFGQATAEKALPWQELSLLEPASTQDKENPPLQLETRPPSPPGNSSPDQASFQERLALAESGLFVEGLLREGKILPRHEALLTSLLAGLPPDGVVEFSENGSLVKMGIGPAFRGFLKGLPAAVDFSERSALPSDPESPHAELGRKIARAALNCK